MTTIQMMMISLVVSVPALARGPKPLSAASDWVLIVYLALVAGALAIGVQTWAQTRIPATQAAIIMAAEPIWAAALAVALLGDLLTWRMAVAAAMLLDSLSTGCESEECQVAPGADAWEAPGTERDALA